VAEAFGIATTTAEATTELPVGLLLPHPSFTSFLSTMGTAAYEGPEISRFARTDATSSPYESAAATVSSETGTQKHRRVDRRGEDISAAKFLAGRLPSLQAEERLTETDFSTAAVDAAGSNAAGTAAVPAAEVLTAEQLSLSTSHTSFGVMDISLPSIQPPPAMMAANEAAEALTSAAVASATAAAAGAATATAAGAATTASAAAVAAAAAARTPTAWESAPTKEEIAEAVAPVAELGSRPGTVARSSPATGTGSQYVCTRGGGDGNDSFISNPWQADGESGDLFSAAAAVTLGASAGAAAADTAVGSDVAAAEAPAHIAGRTEQLADLAGVVISRTTTAAAFRLRVTERREATASGGLDFTRPPDWESMSKMSRCSASCGERQGKGDEMTQLDLYDRVLTSTPREKQREDQS